jgi:hypothetical protein
MKSRSKKLSLEKINERANKYAVKHIDKHLDHIVSIGMTEEKLLGNRDLKVALGRAMALAYARGYYEGQEN